MTRPIYRLARTSLKATTAAASTIIAVTNTSKKDESGEAGILGGLGWRYSGNPWSKQHEGCYASSTVQQSYRSSCLQQYNTGPTALCEALNYNPLPYKPSDPAEPITEAVDVEEKTVVAGMRRDDDDSDALYHGLFPMRQLWRPAVEYPLLDDNWDGRQILQQDAGGEEQRRIRKEGVTRHIILIRHGQYDETCKVRISEQVNTYRHIAIMSSFSYYIYIQEDSRRLLTPLGRKQAELTGQRLGKLVRGVNEQFGPCRVKVIRVSDLTRAKETADIIYDNMNLMSIDVGKEVDKAPPDPLLNEGRPCHHIPGGRARPSVVEATDEQHQRIEDAFRKYFYRADMKVEDGTTAVDTKSVNDEVDLEKTQKLGQHPQHEFEIIVCHANIIRYFFCRALQLPPEAWLRLCTFNCSLTYFTIRPTGTVSCRMLGDIGHLPHELCTFSMHTGFNW